MPYIVTTLTLYRCSMPRYMSAEIGAAEMNLSGSCASRGSGGWFHNIDTMAPAPAKPVAPQARTSFHTSLGRNAADNTVVAPTSIGASTDGAALRWNSGIALHTTSPSPSSQAAATRGRRGEQVMPCRRDRLRRTGRAGSEEQCPDFPGFCRRDVGWARRCVRQHLGQRIADDENRGHCVHAIDHLAQARMAFGVGDDGLGPRQPQRVHQKVVLVGRVHRGGHRADPSGTEPEVHPLRACRGEQRDGVPSANADVGQRIRGGARTSSHLLERHRRARDRHQHAVTELLRRARRAPPEL